MDIDLDAQHFATQQRFVERVNKLTGGKKAYVFIDEIQRIENAGLFLKGLYDRRLPYKWLATGSGSLELKEKISESLAGRKRNFFLYPVSIFEFAAFRLNTQISQIPGLLSTDAVTEEQILLQYLCYGGYPKVITSTDEQEKWEVLVEIFQSYIERDIQVLLKIEKSQALIVLLQLLAHRIGRLINYQDLAQMTNLSVATVKHYIWYLQNTFIVEELTPFFTNKEKELVKTPQYYFVDPGLRNYLLNTRVVTVLSPDFGFLFQQLIFYILQALVVNTVATLHYWRTQNQAEVDFVLRDGSRVLPIEVKATTMTKPQVERSLRSFIETYHPEEAWVVNRSLSKTILIENTKVRFLPWYEIQTL